MGRIGPEILGRLFDEHAAALVLYARPWCDAPEDIVQDASSPWPGKTRARPRRRLALSRGAQRRDRRLAAVAAASASRASAPPIRSPSAGGSWFDATDDRIDAAHAARLLDELDPETRAIIIARALGRPDLRGGRPAPGLLADDRSPPIPGRARPAAREARIPMTRPIDNHGLGADLSALERRLAAWRPAAGALDRDRMLYDAGRAAAAPAASGPGDWRLPRCCS